MRKLPLAVVVLVVVALQGAACSEPAAPPAAPKPAAPAGPVVAPGAAPGAPRPAALEAGRLPESAQKDELRAAKALAEIELAGTISGAKGAKFVVQVLPGPCTLLVGAGSPTYGGTHQAAGDSWATEVFAPRGTPVHVCAAGLDANGLVISLGGWKENPQAFSEEGENMRNGVELVLVALPAPRPLAGLTELNAPKPAGDGAPVPPLGLKPVPGALK